ncbi:hypothetical protein Q5689_30170 [Microcoleus sp. ARI1-A2]
MICWLAILICDRFNDRHGARSVVSGAPCCTKAVGANLIGFETGSLQDFVDADRFKKDCSTNASIERL